MIDPITKQKITAQDLLTDISRIRRHIEVAPDEATEAAYRETLWKWKCKLAKVLECNPPKRQSG